MIDKRRDNKNRVLLRGESQRADGRYEYKYRDVDGNRHSTYSWRLTVTDRTPAGRRDCVPLREQEQQIQADLTDGIRAKQAERVTLNDRATMWFTDQRQYLDFDTLNSYISLYNKHVRDTLGRRKLKNISHTDLRRLYCDMVDLKGLSVQTALALNSCVGQILQDCVNDDLIRKNPAKDATAKLSASHRGETADKIALTATQQANLLAFVARTPRFQRVSNLLTVLFGTGMRVSEVCGLTREACNFRQSRITVCRQLKYRQCEDGRYGYRLKEALKTEAGYRNIPMLPAVREALQAEVTKSKRVKDEFRLKPVKVRRIKGKDVEQEMDKWVSGFIFLNFEGKPYQTHAINQILNDIVAAYNAEEVANAKQDGRKPELMPHVSPHICRHSFASRLHEAGVDPLTIKAVMGHRSFKTDAETYITVDFSNAKSGLDAVADQMCLGDKNTTEPTEIQENTTKVG